MKRILLIGISFGLLALPAIGLALVQTVPPTLDILVVLERIVDWLFTILLIIAAISIVVAAYFFVTAAGEPEKVSKARQFVIYALIGVAVAIGARGLVVLVRSIVGT